MRNMTEYMREYRKTDKWKKYHREYNRKWRKLHGHRKDILRKKIYMKVKRGQIDKKPCEVCGEVLVEMHHDDYRKPLEVMFLCKVHHRERDVLIGSRKS